MARRQQVLIVLPSGSQLFMPLRKAERMIESKRAEWIEEGVSARSLTPRGFVNCSGQMGPHYEWLPRPSGGAVVMQLV